MVKHPQTWTSGFGTRRTRKKVKKRFDNLTGNDIVILVSSETTKTKTVKTKTNI
jgi:hypothetical protein